MEGRSGHPAHRAELERLGDVVPKQDLLGEGDLEGPAGVLGLFGVGALLQRLPGVGGRSGVGKWRPCELVRGAVVGTKVALGEQLGR